MQIFIVKSKIMKALLFIITFIWQLPQNLVAILMLPFLGKLKLISFKKLCFAFEGENMIGGISLGNFAFLSPRLSRDAASVAHEQEGHTHDSKLFGPLYLFVIELPSLIHAWLYDKNTCYYDFWTERRANRFANVEVKTTSSGYCYTIMKGSEN